MFNPEDLIKNTIASVPRPYMGKPNLFITFLIETGEFTIDSAGNEVPVKTPVKVNANVRAGDRLPTDMPFAGTGLISIELEGRCAGLISPSINYEADAIAHWVDEASGLVQKGTLNLTAIVPDRFKAIEEKMGTYIRCELIIKASA